MNRPVGTLGTVRAPGQDEFHQIKNRTRTITFRPPSLQQPTPGRCGRQKMSSPPCHHYGGRRPATDDERAAAHGRGRTQDSRNHFDSRRTGRRIAGMVNAMTLRQMFELIPEVWEAYRPWLPMRTAKEYLTTVGHPDDALLGDGHWVAIAYVAVSAVVLLGVWTAVAHRRAAPTMVQRATSPRLTSLRAPIGRPTPPRSSTLRRRRFQRRAFHDVGTGDLPDGPVILNLDVDPIDHPRFRTCASPSLQSVEVGP